MAKVMQMAFGDGKTSKPQQVSESPQKPASAADAVAQFKRLKL